MSFVLIKMSKNVRTLRSWKSGSQVWKCCDQEDEEADWIKKIFATPWMGRSRRKKDQLLYIPQGHPPGGRPRGRRGPHWYGLLPYWTSAIPGHPEAFSIAFPTFPPALCSPWQASPWSGGHLWSYCYWVVGGLLSAQALPAAEIFPESKRKMRPHCMREYGFTFITALCSLGSAHTLKFPSLPFVFFLLVKHYKVQLFYCSGIHAGGIEWDFPIWTESPRKQVFTLKGKRGPTVSGNK